MKLLVRLFLIPLILSVGSSGFAQTRNYGKQAYALWKAGLWHDAAKAYEKAYTKTHPKTQKAKELKALYAYRSGECYRLIRYYALAEQSYEKSILLKHFNSEARVYYYLGEMQMAQGKHQKALDSFKKYKQLGTGDPLTDIRIKSCESYPALYNSKSRHTVDPLTKLNTPQFDFSPTMDKRGRVMYFSSSRKNVTGDEKDGTVGEGFSDIFESQLDKTGNFTEPKIVQGINTEGNEGQVCFDNRGKKLFFTRCEVTEYNLGCDIYVATKRGSKFDKPVKIELKDHDSTNVGHPCVSPDGNTMIFASNMAGGEGGVDLWMTEYSRKTKDWSLPVNLGPEINTSGNDMFPTWGPDNTLYYSSDGMIGAGGLDIYKAQKIKEENKWIKPENIGIPLNSFADDYHIIFTGNGRDGYLSSNRPGAKTNGKATSQDLWSFSLPPVPIRCIVKLIDQETRQPVSGIEVIIKGSNQDKYVMTSNEMGEIELSQKDDGSRYITQGESYLINVPDVAHQWLGNKDSLLTRHIDEPTTLVKEIPIINIDNKAFRLPEIRFDFGTDHLTRNDTVNSRDSLKYLYHLMKDHPNIVVQLITNTDSRGEREFNRKLAQRRANACVNYLIGEMKLPQDRLEALGNGEDVPIIYHDINPQGDTIASFPLTERYINQFKTDKVKFEALHLLNRRTEAKVISFDYVKPL